MTNNALTVRRVLRDAAALLAGIFVGSAVNMGLIMLNTSVLYPLPEGVSFEDTEAFGEYIAGLPLPAFLVVFAAHFGQVLVGGWTAARLASSNDDAMLLSQLVGALTLLGAVVNNLSLPVPTWTWIELPFYPVLAWIVGRPGETTKGDRKNK